MKRKKICIFMNEIVQSFQQEFGKYFSRLANRAGIDVFIYTSFGSYSCPYGRNLLTEIGKKNIIYLPDFSAFDAIIALPNSFDIRNMDTEFYDLVRKTAKCPVFCLQSGPADFNTVTINNKKTMKELTEHFIKIHGYSRIYYMSGPFTSKDSPERLEGYKEAMAEAGLEVKPNYIYEGNYWLNRGKKAMEFFLNGTYDYPEAIICANDYMAISICDELMARGKSVPDDVAVAGFDGIVEGAEYTPSLTTVTIEPDVYALKVFELMIKAMDGKDISRLTELHEKIIYRASCGCGCQVKAVDHTRVLRRLDSTEMLLREAGRITADYQNDYDLDNALKVADFYFYTLGCDKGYVCLCKQDPSKGSDINQDELFTEHMILKQAMYMDRSTKAEKIDLEFDRKDVLPAAILDPEEPHTHIIYPLHFKSKEYGYLVLIPSDNQWTNSLAATYINTLSNAIENSYYEKRFRLLNGVKKMSQTDPLTGLSNRRGFEEDMSVLLSDSLENKIISIVSIDMDGLKQINDEYGHAEGDLALNTFANTLLDSLRKTEICARFGGDEFIAVLVSDSDERKTEFKTDFIDKLEAASDKLNKPYRIQASIGICDIAEGTTDEIITSMQIADQRMYEEKRKHKNA